MNKKWFIYVILFLALLSLSSSIFSNTSWVIRSLIGTVTLMVLIIGLVYFIKHRQPEQNELKKYRKAVKQSKKLQKQATHSCRKKSAINQNRISSKRSKKAPHLRVIEGKKSTKKDPVSYG